MQIYTKKNYWKIIKHDKFVKIKSMQVSSICIHKVLEDRWSKSPFFCQDLASTAAVEDNLLMIVQFATKMHFRSRPPLRQAAAACYVAKQFFSLIFFSKLKLFESHQSFFFTSLASLYLFRAPWGMRHHYNIYCCYYCSKACWFWGRWLFLLGGITHTCCCS